MVWSIARRKPSFNVRRRCPSRHSVPCRRVPHRREPKVFRRRDGQLASPGFAGNLVSGGEAEGLHFVGVLSFGDEFREDGALGGIQEKFGEGVA